MNKIVVVGLTLISIAMSGCQTSGSSSGRAAAEAAASRVLTVNYEHSNQPITIFLDADNNVVGTDGPIYRLDRFEVSGERVTFSGRMNVGAFGARQMSFKLPVDDDGSLDVGSYAITSGCNQNCGGVARAAWSG